MNENKSLASIIVLNWNGKYLLEQSIPSIVEAVEYDGEQHEIILLDNGSTDGSIEYVKNYFPSVRVIALGSNLGFIKANNIGVRESINDIVILLNNDIIVSKDFIRPLLDNFFDPSIFAVSCKLLLFDRMTINFGKPEGYWNFGMFFVRQIGYGERDVGQIDDAKYILYASGGAAAFDRKKFLELGGFDELFYPFYWEDTDLSYRALKRGWLILFETRSILYHKHQATIKKLNMREVELAPRKNNFLFIWKNITDKRLIIEHVILLPINLLIALIFLRYKYLWAFVRALKQFGQVWDKRRVEERFIKKSDREVLRMISSKGSIFRYYCRRLRHSFGRDN